MAINFGALLRYAPAAAQGLASYRRGAMAGEREREQNERADAAALFEQFARRRQLEQQDRTINQREELRSMQDAANLERERMRAEAANLRNQLDNATRERTTGMTVGGRKDVAGMQYGEGGQGDRDNTAAMQRAMLAYQAALARIAAQGQGQGQGRRPQRPTGEQEKSYLYYGLMQEGNKTMGMFSDKIRPEVIGAYVSSRWFKPALTPEEQQFMQGARNFAAGVLRKETGAAIKDDELRDVMARFIDMPLDAPATREQKRKSRAEYERRMGLLARPVQEYYEEGSDTTPPPTAPQGTSRARGALNRIRGQ